MYIILLSIPKNAVWNDNVFYNGGQFYHGCHKTLSSTQQKYDYLSLSVSLSLSLSHTITHS